MLILGLLGMYFDAAVVFVTSQTLLLKLAVAILCCRETKQNKIVDSGIVKTCDELTFILLLLLGTIFFGKGLFFQKFIEF